MATIQSVLGWPENREAVYATLDPVIEQTTAVDGVTGEKGLAGYTAFTIQGLALLLSQFSRIDSRFLADEVARHPRLRETFRFHIDTWCLGRYYPRSGDTGAFARADEQYAGVSLSREPGLDPSGFTFLWQLYELTGDPAYAQVLYLGNGRSVEGLPYDLLAADPDGFQQAVKRVIEREGPEPRLPSVHKKEWRLAILRAGSGDDARALWLDYDSGGPHGHRDGLNLGLRVRAGPSPRHGLSARSVRGLVGAARGLVYDDRGAQHSRCGRQKSGRGWGAGTLWADGSSFRAVRASAPDLIGGSRYERTAAMIDLSDDRFYVFDHFRVVGGVDHAYFLHSHFGRLRTDGLVVTSANDYGHDTQMRAFRHAEREAADRAPWSVTWEIEDRYRYRGDRPPLRVRYTDLTAGAEHFLAEGWVSDGFALGNPESLDPAGAGAAASAGGAAGVRVRRGHRAVRGGAWDRGDTTAAACSGGRRGPSRHRRRSKSAAPTGAPTCSSRRIRATAPPVSRRGMRDWRENWRGYDEMPGARSIGLRSATGGCSASASGHSPCANRRNS